MTKLVLTFSFIIVLCITSSVFIIMNSEMPEKTEPEPVVEQESVTIQYVPVEQAEDVEQEPVKEESTARKVFNFIKDF